MEIKVLYVFLSGKILIPTDDGIFRKYITMPRESPKETAVVLVCPVPHWLMCVGT